MNQEHAFEPRLNLQAARHISGGGGYRLGNLLIWALALYLLWPMFGHESAHPALWGYSGGFLVLLLAVVLGMVAWLVVLTRLAALRQRTLFFVTVLALAGLEGLFRLDMVAKHFTAFHQVGGIVPYLCFDGPREALDQKTDGDGTYRIVMVGGSTVGDGDPSLAKALEEVFHAEGRPEVRVYNYGAARFVARQERLRLELDALPLRPDLVIVYDGANDVSLPYFDDPRPRYPANWATVEAGCALTTNTAGFRRSVSLVLRSSALLRCLFDDVVFKEDIVHMRRLRAEAGYGEPKWRQALTDGWLEDWEAMARMSRCRSARAVFLLQPFLTEKRELSESEKDIDARYDEAFHAHMRACYDRMRAGLEAFAGKAPDGVAARDLSRALDDFAGQAFVDVTHVGAEANRHLARKIHEIVSPLVDQDRPLPPGTVAPNSVPSAPVAPGTDGAGATTAPEGERGQAFAPETPENPPQPAAQGPQAGNPPASQVQPGAPSQPQARKAVVPRPRRLHAPSPHGAPAAVSPQESGGGTTP